MSRLRLLDHLDPPINVPPPGCHRLAGIQWQNVNRTNLRCRGRRKRQHSSGSVSRARIGVRDLDQPLPLLVSAIRRTPVFLHRDVSTPAKWGHR